MPKYTLVFLVLFLVSLSAIPAAAQWCEAVDCGYCGDGYCSQGEQWCTADCTNCGDGICSPELGEDRYTCTTDCVCGDGVCSYGEDASNCAYDCACGDGICSPEESSDHCPQDCPVVCTPDSCSSCGQPAFGDYDTDSVPDNLEYDLAHAFFPNIMLQTLSDDLYQSYLFNAKAIPYTVHPGPVSGICNEAFKCLEIRYGTAYLRDVGTLGHLGDSEFYAAIVMRTTPWSSAQFDANQWQIVRDFTAAHWKTFTDSSRYGAYGYCSPNCRIWDNNEDACLAHMNDRRGCTTVPGQCLGGASSNYWPCSYYGDQGSCFFAGGSCHWSTAYCLPNAAVCDQDNPLSSAPTLYASKGKHGLYHTIGECNAGAYGTDSCSSQAYNMYNMRNHKGSLLQNIGEDNNHGSFDGTMQYPDNCKLYNVWDSPGFGGATAYREHFAHGFGWPLN